MTHDPKAVDLVARSLFRQAARMPWHTWEKSRVETRLAFIKGANNLLTQLANLPHDEKLNTSGPVD